MRGKEEGLGRGAVDGRRRSFSLLDGEMVSWRMVWRVWRERLGHFELYLNRDLEAGHVHEAAWFDCGLQSEDTCDSILVV